MTAGSFSQAISTLQQAVALSSGNDVRAIDQALATLMSYHDPECIASLLLLLDDTTRQDEGMWSIIHSAESFGNNTYVGELLSILPQLCAKAPAWASILLMRVLNEDNARHAIVRAVRSASDDVKTSTLWLCVKINERSPTFLAKTTALQIAAGGAGT
jgi:hypothetical protein